ncbi:MAG: hypothetical protein GVY13_02575, partial [Alphaproteobacteria bacterium]|nr:hypothetical protein [Alphaproteobacteria bacterium]
DFSDEDRLFVRASHFGRDDVTVEDGSAILNIDSNRDGETDTVLTLEGDFSGMEFEVASDEAGTTIQIVPADEGGATFPAEPNLFDVLLPTSGRLVLPSGTHAKLIDAPGSQTVDIAQGAGFTLSGASGENIFRFEQNSNAFTVARVDNRLELTADDGAVTHLPPDADPQTLVFADGSAALTIDGAQLMLGNMVVNTEASPITATLNPSETSEGVFASGFMLHLAETGDGLL